MHSSVRKKIIAFGFEQEGMYEKLIEVFPIIIVRAFSFFQTC